MMIEDPKRFALMAHEWAVKYAGAPRQDVDLTKYQNDVAAAPVKDDNAR